MKLSSDVAQQIKILFPAAERLQALDLIEKAVLHDGRAADVRCQRCAIAASQGSLQKLDYYVSLLKVDYRDVIVAGEYYPIDSTLVRVRDLSQPFCGESGSNCAAPVKKRK